MLDFKHTDRTRREFESLSLDHLDALYSAGLRLTKNERDAEDLVQDTFLRAFRFFDKFERGTNMKAWLFKILTNTFINKYRRRVKERTVVEGAARESGNERFVTHEPTESSADPEQYFFDKLLSDDVIRSIDLLPIDFRLVVILADLGVVEAVKRDKALALGVNTFNGHTTYKAVAEAHEFEYTPLDKALATRK